DFPKYLVLREKLILKLEFIIRQLQGDGHDINDFEIMSGYRTPYYNKQLNNVPHSRHLWGGAADIYVDSDNNGRMDDLNGDGASDWRDSRWLARYIKSFRDNPDWNRWIGGVGYYDSTSMHGPFVHVDARGFPASWSGISDS
ncbi:MAG: hypothetical protein ABEJ65_08105, partial [bacterium]